MTCAPCTSSLEPVADSLQTSFLDTHPLSPSSGTPMPAEFCASAPLLDGSPVCACTKVTCGCSIHPNSSGEWTASMRDSLARILASPDLVRASMASEADSTAKSSAALTWYDHHSCSWKTPQQLLEGDWEPYSETWPRAGTMRAGRCWPLPTWVRPINGNGGGALLGVPTPTSSQPGQGDPSDPQRGKKLGWWANQTWQTPVSDDSVDRLNGKWNSRGEPKLSAQVKLYPTPTVSQAVQVRGQGAAAFHPNRRAAREAQVAKRSKPLRDVINAQVGGSLNPTWVEWLMAWPVGWTVCAPLATAKSRSARQRRGASLGVREI